MPKRTDIQNILIIGSGPIVIGQGCEFDYSGTQACKALREEGYDVVLINSNPATIMTDPEMADRTYIEPITPEFIEKILIREKREQWKLNPATIGSPEKRHEEYKGQYQITLKPDRTFKIVFRYIAYPYQSKAIGKGVPVKRETSGAWTWDGLKVTLEVLETGSGDVRKDKRENPLRDFRTLEMHKGLLIAVRGKLYLGLPGDVGDLVLTK